MGVVKRKGIGVCRGVWVFDRIKNLGFESWAFVFK